MGLGQLLGPSPGRRAHPGPGTQVDSIVADGQLEVCDGAHRIIVMKKGRRQQPGWLDEKGRRCRRPSRLRSKPWIGKDLLSGLLRNDFVRD
jgi:hypothetical protein